jgi:hypothetical protein
MKQAASKTLVLATSMALALAACGRPERSATSPAPKSPSVSATQKTNALIAFIGPVRSREVWDGGTVIMDPPAVGDRPTVSVDAVLATCKSNQSVCGPADAVVHVAYGRATSPGTGTNLANGATDPLMKNRLVYEMSWTGVQCPIKAHLTGSTETFVLPSSTCTLVSWVDARSGNALYSLSGGIGPT